MLNKKALILIAFLAVALILAWFFVIPKNKAVAYQAEGNIKSVGSDSITIEGQYDLTQGASQYKGLIPMVVKVTSGTKITRSSFVVPVGKAFEPSKLPKTDTVVSLDTLRSDVKTTRASMIVKSKKNIYGSASFEASEITYTIGVYQTTNAK